MPTNSRLFVIDGLPLKVYFENLKHVELVESINLFTEYGGVVVTKPNRHTLVLCRSASSESRLAAFHVNWLHDCITRNQLLELVPYMLGSTNGIRPANLIKTEVFRAIKGDVPSDSPVTSDQMADGSVVGVSEGSESTMFSQKEQTRTLSTSSIPAVSLRRDFAKFYDDGRSDTSSLIHTSSNPSSETHDGISVAGSLTDSTTSEASGLSEFTFVPFLGFSTAEQKSKYANVNIGTDIPASSKNPTALQILQVSTADVPDASYKEKTSKEEDRNNFTVSVEKSKDSSDDCIVISSDSEDSDVRINNNNNNSYNLRSKENFKNMRLPFKYQRDSSTSSDDSDVELEPVRKQRRKSSNITCSQKRTCHLYSPAECQRMINYLVENDAVAQATGSSIWRKAKAEGLFEEPYRSAKALQMHFRLDLRYNFRNYTDNPVALSELENLENEGYSLGPKPCYSEVERRKMVQYLIENHAISKARGLKIWQQMEADRILLKPYRSAVALRAQFSEYLRYCYMDYTNNWEALNEFSKFE